MCVQNVGLAGGIGNRVTAAGWPASTRATAFIFIFWWHWRPIYSANDLALVCLKMAEDARTTNSSDLLKL